MRTQKTVNGVVHDYVLDGTRILADYSSGSELVFAYGENNTPQSFTYNGTKYNYVTNLQGDVMEIHDGANNVVGSYVYNAYGQIISKSGAMADINPIRYRGYYHDAETGFYYLNSRYYDSEIGRFISADSYVSTGQGSVGFNMFAYCNNNPVNMVDRGGKDAGAVAEAWTTGMWWIIGFDGPVPVLDAIYAAGVIVLGTIAIVSEATSAQYISNQNIAKKLEDNFAKAGK